MKTILIPTDFSKAAGKAVELAIQLARAHGSTLVLLHVLEGAGKSSFNVSGEAATTESWQDKIFSLKMIEKAKTQLRLLGRQVKDAGVAVKLSLRMGNAYHGIRTIIAEQKADLIVMGTKGSSGLEGLLVGSNAEKVVRRSACPVLTVHENSTIRHFKSVVWATSLLEGELKLPPVARRLIERNGATVHLVRINTPAWFIPDKITKPKLADFGRRMKLKSYTTHVCNDLNEEEGLIQFARAMEADLMMLSTHGRTGLARLLNGSIAEGLVNRARTPVLTYKIK